MMRKTKGIIITDKNIGNITKRQKEREIDEKSKKRQKIDKKHKKEQF